MAEEDREALLRKQVQALAAAGLGRVRRAGPQVSLDAVVDELRRDLACEAARLYLREEDGLHLVEVQNERVDATTLSAIRGERLPLGPQTPAGHVAATGQAYRTDDPSTLPANPGFDPPGFRTRALLAVPLRDGDGEVIGVLELKNPRGASGGFDAAQEARAVERAAQAAGAVEAERLERGYLDAVFGLAMGVESEDPEIHGHVRRISGYSEAMARALGLDADTVRWIRLASPLHDVGKVGIPRETLYKPGKLSEEEFDITKQHTLVGHAILGSVADSPLFATAAEIALSHHERWDGGGYPHGVQGTAIPIAGRIAAVADVFDALTTRRIYKPALGIEQSLKIIRQEAGRHFDPDLVDAFQGIFAEILDVKTRFSAE